MKVTENGAVNSRFSYTGGDGVMQAFILNKVIAAGTGVTDAVIGHTDDATYTAGVGFQTNTPANIWVSEPATNTGIRTSDNTSFFFGVIDSVLNTEYVSNFTNSFSSSLGTGPPSLWRIHSTKNTGADYYATYVFLWGENAARNISRNIIQWNFTTTTNANQWEINITSSDITKVNINISCNEGTNWASGRPNTTITCSAGSSNKIVLRADFNHTLGNLSYISTSPIGIVSDTEPSAMTLINLSSEGGNGQIIFDLIGGINKKLDGEARTNDTTPTIRATTNKSATCRILDRNVDLNYSQSTASDCGTTGSLNHICTLAVANMTERIGLHNFSIGCKDANGNENRTSTSGKFTINITSPNAPNATLFRPRIDEFFIVGINTTNINFTFFGLIENERDNDRNFTAELLIDEAIQITNSTYLNGTNATYLITYTTVGRHNWSVRMTDSFNNVNYSGNRSFLIQKKSNITLLLDGQNDTRMYEYPRRKDRSDGTVNITARIINITILIDSTTTTCVTIDANKNISCNTGNWSYYYNITELKQDRITNGSTRFNMSSGINNITLNVFNTSDILHFTINLTGHDVGGFPNNVTLDIDKDNRPDITFPGKLRGKIIETDNFLAQNQKKNAHNSTFSAGGSVTIFVNSSAIENLDRLTFEVSGFDLDMGNEFRYIEQFNGTDGSKVFNDTLTFQSDAPIGVFDDFRVNVSGRWTQSGNNLGLCDIFSYEPNTVGEGGTSGNHLKIQCGQGGANNIDYSDASADLRNSSRIENELRWEYFDIVEDPLFQIMATDGTSTITLYSATTSQGIVNYNFTYIKKSNDYKTWEVLYNGTSSGNKDLSALDFDKQIKIQWRIRGGNRLNLYNVKWSGAWLNYSANNGTYKPTGNITQCVNTTKTNTSRALLTVSQYVPSNTGIQYFLSNTGNSTNPIFESTTPGTIHTFQTVGNIICARGRLNSSINTTSPVIRIMQVDIISGALQNVSVDFGNDGDNDWSFNGILNLTSSPKVVNGSMADFITYRNNNCKNSPTCTYPITLSAVSGGTLQISKMNSTINITNLNLNISKVRNVSTINLTLSFLGGLLELDGIDFNFMGNKNFTITATHEVTGDILESNESHIAQVLFSKYNKTLPYQFTTAIVPLPRGNNDTNVTPFGQTDTTPILNFSGKTKYALNHNFDLGLRLNQTYSCLEVKANNNSNTSLLSEGINLTSTMRTFATNVSGNGSIYLWLFFDFYNCNATIARSLRPSLEQESCCSNCTRCW